MNLRNQRNFYVIISDSTAKDLRAEKSYLDEDEVLPELVDEPLPVPESEPELEELEGDDSFFFFAISSSYQQEKLYLHSPSLVWRQTLEVHLTSPEARVHLPAPWDESCWRPP